MSLRLRFRNTPMRVVSLVSALLLAAVCHAGPYSDMQKRLATVKTAEEVVQAVTSNGTVSSQPDIRDELKAVKDSRATPDEAAKELREMIDLAANAEGRRPTSTNKVQAGKIKRSALYVDQGIDRSRNWLGDAIERLKNIHMPKPKARTRSGPGIGILGEWIVYLMWALLIGAVIVLLFYAIRYIDWKKALTRRAKALVEDDEPERTLDEWLQLADSHTLAGRYREAIRALYLACLLKFDEYNIARFERGETNWEHLNRIQGSVNLPADLDFRTPTQEFDRVWYGKQVRGMSDVELFRGWYSDLSTLLEKSK